MKLLSINVGTPQMIAMGGRSFLSAIYKRPVSGPVRFSRHGVRGDAQAEENVHGGMDQAVHLMPVEHYLFWSQRFGHTMYGHGALGENLTVSGALEGDLCLGDRLRVGEVLLEVTKPRTPCFKVEAIMGMKGFTALMAASGRVGCYLRVLEEGMAEAGKDLTFERRDPAHVTVGEAFAIIQGKNISRELLERAATVHAQPVGFRRKIERMLAQFEDGSLSGPADQTR